MDTPLFTKYLVETFVVFIMIAAIALFLCLSPRPSIRDLLKVDYPTVQGTVFVLFILSTLTIIDTLCPLPSGVAYKDLVIGVLSVYGIIIFALLISIIESGRSSGPKDMTRTLLRSSYIYPLCVAEIFIALSLLRGEFGVLTIAMLLGLGSALICSIYQVINILTRRSLFLEKRIELLVDVLTQLSVKAKDGDQESQKLIEEETAGLRDDFENHIRNGSVFFVEEYIDIYETLAWDLLQKGVRINHPKNFSTSWDWLRNDLSDVIALAYLKADSTTLRDINYLPIKIAFDVALTSKEAHLFESCLQVIPEAYTKTIQSSGDETHSSIIEQLHPWIRERVDILPYRKYWNNFRSEEGVDFIKNCFLSILKAYKELLKTSYDRNRSNDFDALLKASRALAYQPRDKKDKVEKDLQVYLFEHLHDMLFCLSSWILHDLLDNKNKKAFVAYKSYMEAITQENNPINPLIHIYAKPRKELLEMSWGLDWWESFERHEKDSVNSGYHSQNRYWLLRNFTVQAAYALSKTKEDELKYIIRPVALEIKCRLSSEREEILSQLSALENEEWTQRLDSDPNAFKNGANNLKKYLNELSTEAVKEKDRRKKPISKEQVILFKSEIRKVFKERCSLIKLLKQSDKYKENTDPIKEGDTRFGFTRVENKEWFFGSWLGTAYAVDGLAGSIGKNLTLSEEKEIYSSLVQNLENRNQKIELSIKHYEDAFDRIDRDSIDQYVILISSRAMYETLFKDSGSISGEFPPKYIINESAIKVINPLCYPESKGKMLLLNTKTLPVWTQYTNPRFKYEKEENVKDDLYINVEAFSENQELLKRFMEINEKSLQERGDEEAQKKYLEGLVYLEVYEKFDLSFDAENCLEGSLLVTFTDL